MDGNMMNNMNRQPGGSQQQRPARRSGRLLIVTVLVLLVLFVLGVAGYVVAKKVKSELAVDSEYQAVFLTNGQVYFGKIDFEHKWVVMKDIYYLQVTQDLQAASGGSSNTQTTNGNANNNQNQQQKINLVKLGSELHGPTDEMFIARDKILFWENMKDDSKVLQSIKQYKAQ